MKAWGITLPDRVEPTRQSRTAAALTACADRVRRLERQLAVAHCRIAELELIEAQFTALNAALDDLLSLEARGGATHMPGGAGLRS